MFEQKGNRVILSGGVCDPEVRRCVASQEELRRIVRI